MRKTRPLVVAALVLALSACGQAVDDDGAPGPDRRTDASVAPRQPDHVDHASRPFRHFDSPDRVREAFSDGTVTFEAEQPFRQLGFMFDAPPETRLEWRRPGDERWQPVEITWNEADAYVARLVLDAPHRSIELRASAPLESLYVEFYEDVLAPIEGDGIERPIERGTTAPKEIETEVPGAAPEPQGRAPSAPDGEFRTTRQREAPASLVIPREDWGAREPDCYGSKHDPYRMTIHHTASPDDDGGDPAKRMRQMQNYHMDSNGWCDIGYHFVVSQSGKIYQGRPTEKRTGAHVGGHNTGNIGISLIGNFEQQTVNAGQFDATIDIAHWVHDTYNIPLDRQHVKGHNEWSGQSTSCPGDNLLNRLGELVRKIKNHGGSSAAWDVAVDTEFRGTTNRYKQGSSQDRPDAMPGDTINAEIHVTNQSSDPIGEVWIGYDVSGEHLTPTSYTIYDDHPAHDKQSWDVNDASSADENPAKSKLGESGKLYLSALSPNETKRIHVELNAETYSAGTTTTPHVRGWVRDIENVFGTRDTWGADPSTNKVGKPLRAESHVDILSRDQWMFGNEESPKNLEGWSGRGDYEQLIVNPTSSAMAMQVSGSNARVVSPDWTRVDAETYDQMVLRFRAHDGPHPVAVSWRGDDESFSDQRSLRFRLPGDGEFHTYRLPLATHADWSGEVTRLRIHPLEGRAPASDASAWYDIGAVYFRASSDQSTTADAPLENGSTIDPIAADDDGSSNDPPDDDATTGDPPTGDESNGSDDSNDNGTDDGLVGQRASMEDVRVNQGCSVGESGPAPVSLGWLLLVLVAGAGGRKD